MRGSNQEGARRRRGTLAPSSILTIEEARAAAALLSTEGLVVRAQDYISRYGRDIRSERGGVPFELAAVLGVLHSGKPGFFWYVSPRVQEALEVGRGASPALQLWAGLRVTNEAALLLEHIQGAAGIRVGQLTAADFWAAVLRLESLGPRVFVELCRRAGGALQLAAWVTDNDPGQVGELRAGTIVYRVLAVSKWLEAAAELCASHGAELEHGPGVLIESRDARVRRIAKKATLGGWAISQVAMLIRTKAQV